jgi:hypothetical protein
VADHRGRTRSLTSSISVAQCIIGSPVHACRRRDGP